MDWVSFAGSRYVGNGSKADISCLVLEWVESGLYSAARAGSDMLKYISVRKLSVAMLDAPLIAPSIPSA